jgi:hypothetical protein
MPGVCFGQRKPGILVGGARPAARRTAAHHALPGSAPAGGGLAPRWLAARTGSSVAACQASRQPP